MAKVEEAKEFILKLKSEKEALDQQIQSLQEQSSKQVSEIDVAIQEKVEVKKMMDSQSDQLVKVQFQL